MYNLIISLVWIQTELNPSLKTGTHNESKTNKIEMIWKMERLTRKRSEKYNNTEADRYVKCSQNLSKLGECVRPEREVSRHVVIQVDRV
jgi:hypothetical protein